MAFQKGNRANPYGRPKLEGDPAVQFRHAGGKAMNVLVKLLKSDSERSRIAAAELLLERIYGKPTQQVSGVGGGPIEYVVKWNAPATSPETVKS